MHVGEVITLPVSLNESSPVNSESRKKREGAEQQLRQHQKVILSMEIGLATAQSLGHQRGLLLCPRLQLDSELQ